MNVRSPDSVGFGGDDPAGFAACGGGPVPPRASGSEKRRAAQITPRPAATSHSDWYKKAGWKVA